MIRMTRDQASLFQKNIDEAAGKRPKGKSTGPRVKRKKSELPENIVAKQITDFLKAMGWAVTRQHVGTYTPYRILMQLTDALKNGANMAAELEKARHNIIRIGKEGDADWWMYRRYPRPAGHEGSAALCQFAFLEMKGPGKKPEPHQLLWLEARRATGTPADWFDSFDVGKRPFISWYRKMFDPGLPLTAEERF